MFLFSQNIDLGKKVHVARSNLKYSSSNLIKFTECLKSSFNVSLNTGGCSLLQKEMYLSEKDPRVRGG